MKNFAVLLLLAIIWQITKAQDDEGHDSLSLYQLEEVIVVSKPGIRHYQQAKPLSTLDEYLEKSGKVNMVKRGAYAWEPMINSMTSERLAITIDGMHVFGACTDKMDPITSYVDVSNLSEIAVFSGQQGSGFGPSIGGGINMVRQRNNFDKKGWSGSLDAGFESNGLLQTNGAGLNYSSSVFFADVDVMYRDASNYKAGDRQEIPYSQFTKYNLSATTGVLLNSHHLLEASVIFDKATDVGYPALPMDVSLARAIIGSVRYERMAVSKYFHNWETKLYYNTITHQMDDSERPDIPIRMDMPGWSKTTGFYSRISGCVNKHQLQINLTGYHNQALAEMTMFPVNPEESEMFMYTWPDVRTSYLGVFVEDKIALKKHHSLRFSASTGLHRNLVADDFGLNSLQIFYPKMKASQVRNVSSLSAGYLFQNKDWEVGVSTGYGERAPSVSEGYGFYLFNSFDAFDYVGNPDMPNEHSLEFHANASFKKDKIRLSSSANYFYFLQYIIGVPEQGLIPMTIGARGIKIYQALPEAHIFNVDLNAQYLFHPSWKLQGNVSYSLGRDHHGMPLPMIRPVSYQALMVYRADKYFAELGVSGNSRQWSFSKNYGEDLTKGFAIVNCSAGYAVYPKSHRLFLKAGIENLLDSRYSTFADWNNLLRKGRSFYINISFMFDKKVSL